MFGKLLDSSSVLKCASTIGKQAVQGLLGQNVGALKLTTTFTSTRGEERDEEAVGDKVVKQKRF